jgi:tetratricopeptide (TPR) repeat protein
VTTYRKDGINPLLISIITKKDLSEIPQSPPPPMLPGVYVRQVRKNLSNTGESVPERKHELTCTACGKRGQYNLGTIVVDMEKFLKRNDSFDSVWNKAFQCTGYFRCRHCNSAGNWQLSKQTLLFLNITVMTHAMTGMKQDEVVIGKTGTYDGKTFRWASEAEEHHLRKLNEDPDNAWIWNRLGNLYLNGGRPDLAVAAFEESIKHDPGQMESHFSLGQILLKAGLKEAAASHLRRVLITAYKYDRLKRSDLRDMLTETLFTLLDILEGMTNLVEFLPKADEILPDCLESGAPDKTVTLNFREIDIRLDKFEGMYPLAELYMNLNYKKPASDVKSIYPQQQNSGRFTQKKKKKAKKKRKKR